MKKAVRLDKFLADAGAGTRSEVKKYIQKGKVQVNGVPVKKPEIKVSEEDEVVLDGNRISQAPEFVYYLLHKPAGYVSATEDKRDKTVMELVARTVQSCIGGNVRCRQRDCRDVGSLAGFLNNRVIEQHQTVRLDCIDKLLIRRAIHRNEIVRRCHDRRTDRFIGNTNGTVGSTATHFRTVGRQPAEFLAGDQSAVCQNLSGKQNALSAETS